MGGQWLTTAGAAVVVVASTVDTDDPPVQIAVPLALGGQVVTSELGARGAASKPGMGIGAFEAGQAEDVIEDGPTTGFEPVTNHVARNLLRVGIRTQPYPTRRHLGRPRQVVGQAQAIDNRETTRDIRRRVLLSIRGDVDGVVRAESETGVEAVRESLPPRQVDESLR